MGWGAKLYFFLISVITITKQWVGFLLKNYISRWVVGLGFIFLISVYFMFIKNHVNYFYYSELEIKAMFLGFYLFMLSE